ncbi:hypothetical protein AA12717_3746 [Gluconacetobacter sacchari DSM 12717]|nr:hypothetical protein AA12717_3746 [Gluconacetobacter sacchari DSM 12717]
MFRNSRILTALLLSTALASVRASMALAGTLPTGGSFVAGSGQIATSGSAMTINQTSARGVIDWRGFSIGSGNFVQFNNGAGATMNRVTGAQMSQIDGKLGATGSVFLINPNGIVVGPGGQVVTNGSFVASSRDISDGQFMAGGSMTASGRSSSAVVNRGTIRAANGNVVLIGQSVTNEGVIVTGHRTAAMVAADSVVLSETGGPSGIYVAAGSTGRGDVTNAGRIQAAAVELASAHGNVYALGGNHTGAIQATGTREVDGEVYLTAADGTVDVGGRITAHNTDGSGGQIVANGHDVAVAAGAVMDAGSTVAGRAGGTILVGTSGHGQNLAQTVKLADGASLTAGGKGAGLIETSGHHVSTGALTVDAGRGGTWLTDPDDLTIDSAAAGTIQTALNAGTNVSEQTTATGTSGAGSVAAGNGDINVNAPISWTGGATLTLDAYRNLNVSAPITVQTGGGVVIQTGGDDIFNPGGSLTYATSGSGSLSVNGSPYALVWDRAGLESIGTAGTISGNYALAKDVDLGNVAFTPIAHTGNFGGTFDGLGHSVDNLLVNDTTHALDGLFGAVSGTIANVTVSGLIDGRGGPSAYAGGIAGQNNGLIRDSHSSATVYGYYVGGLSGGSASGTGRIERSTASGDVYALDGSPYAGGLAGYAASVTDSSASGNVTTTSSGWTYAGGLVGEVTGAISGSFATGNVTAPGSNERVGGLVGLTNGAISDSYATGTISAGKDAYAGGLVGQSSGDVTSSYATGTVTAGDESYAGGLAGIVRAVTDGRASGNVTGGEDSTVGGLVGKSSGLISDAIAVGNVTAGTYGSAGGLAGENIGGISNSYATGTVTASGAADGAGYAGGLVGDNEAAVSDAYATGAVTGLVNADIGGLVGKAGGGMSGTLSDVYATGALTGQAGQIGGVIGKMSGQPTITDAYFDTTTTGATASVGVTDSGVTASGITGLTTEQFANGSATLAGGSSVWVSGAPYQVLAALPYIVVTGSPGAHETYGSASVTAPTTVTAAASDGIDTSAALAGIGPWHGYSTADAGTYATWAEGVAAPWHQITYRAALTVDPAALTIAAGSGLSVYGQPVSAPGYTVSGLVNGDSVTGATVVNGATSASSVGQYAVDVSRATGRGLGNYVIDYVSGNWQITPATLTATAGDGSSVYGQMPTVAGDGFTSKGLVNGDTISGVTLTTPATKTSSVGTYAINASDATGTGLGNYDISYAPGTLTITPAPLTITAGSGSSVYGQAPATAGFTATGLVNGDAVSGATLTTAATATSSVGQYAINAANATGTGLSNYDISYVPGTLTIDPAALTVVANDQAMTYGNAPSLGNAAFTASGLVNGDSISAVDLSTTATKTSAVGTYGITAANAVGQGLSNYDIAYVPGTLTIDPAALTVAANDQTSTYGNAPALGTTAFTASGLVNGDAVSGVNLATAATGASSVGTYGITASGATGTGLSNYTVTYAPGTLTIDPAALTVTALDQTSTYGQAPALGTTGFTAQGLVNGDAISGVRLTTAATGASSVGDYVIDASSATGHGLGNYAITYQGGTLTVDPATLTVTAGSGSSVYGRASESPGYQVLGLVNGDSVTSVDVTKSATIESGVGSYTTTASNATGQGLSNYTIGYQSGTWTVTPAPLGVTASDQTSTYGQTPLSPTSPSVIAVAAVTPTLPPVTTVAQAPGAEVQQEKLSVSPTLSCSSSGSLVGETQMTCQTRGR